MNGWMRKISAAVGRAPRQTAVLAVLIVVMVALWMRALGRGDGGVSLTSAAVAQTASAPDAATDASSLERKLEAWGAADQGELPRNPFIFQPDFYPQHGSPEAEGPPELKVGFWDELAKSVASQADQRKQRRILIENLRRKASELKVQGIFMGAVPQAMVDGVPVGEGSIVAGFRVLEIQPRGIIVEREGIRLAIQMR